LSASVAKGGAAALGSILVLALAVRLWGIAFGLPYDLTADEPHQIVQALKIGIGEGGPLVRMWHTIGKGGLDYILFGEYGVLFVVLWLTGQVSGPREFGLLYLQDPTWFYLVGRVTVAVLGAATCAAIFAAGRAMYGSRTIGLGAAVIGATAYYHAADAHQINVHVPMAFALWAGIVAYLRYERGGERRWLLIAGLLIGAAVALAYTAGVGLLMVGLALLTSGGARNGAAALARDVGTLGAGVLVSVALMSPDLLMGAGLILGNFSQLLGGRAPAAGDADGVRGAIDSVTILRAQDWLGYARVLVQPYNLASTLLALVGAAVGVWRRERWTLLLTPFVLLLLGVLSASNRGLTESYLFPMIPAVWLLASRGVHAVAARDDRLLAAAFAVVIAVPLFRIVRDDYMLTKPDTRIVAKEWIESHVPSGAKILMDGMRFRFVQGVPLTPDAGTIERRLSGVESSELALSPQTLAMYREAAKGLAGPRYDLHSTMYGLEVGSLDYYVAQCFDYVVISSFNEKRYETDAARARYPHAAAFYRDIRRDPRYHRVYDVDPVVWERIGPTITVYAVACPVRPPARVG
jgi:4-amino-4-deoxy-L-arabinose transferase-like glycosyltransferase